MSSIKIKDTLFPCTNTPEIPYLEFDNLKANIDKEYYNNYRILKPRITKKYDSATHIYGMVPGTYTNTDWTMIDENLNYLGGYDLEKEDYIKGSEDFNYEHGTWKNIKQVINEIGEFTEIPITWVKTDTIKEGIYAGKPCWWIADGEYPGFHIHPCFLDTNGNPHPLRISSYPISKDENNKLHSRKVNSEYSEFYKTSYNKMEDAVNLLNINSTKIYRPYNIYDQHFLARMMMTEFLTSDLRYYVNSEYHGINYPYGYGSIAIWIHGINTVGGVYNILDNKGSGRMINTGISCPSRASTKFPDTCLTNSGDNFDFNDIFIVDKYGDYGGLFNDQQTLSPNKYCWSKYANTRYYGPFEIETIDKDKALLEDETDESYTFFFKVCELA